MTLSITGQDDIEIACENLENRMAQAGSMTKSMIVLPMYAALPGTLQKRCFEPAPKGTRKVNYLVHGKGTSDNGLGFCDDNKEKSRIYPVMFTKDLSSNVHQTQIFYRLW